MTTEYWGFLIEEDKSPAPKFEQLLLGIANYINRQIAPWDTHCLTPAKLAAFYRLVGGDYNVLFLETPQRSLSFIYQSLGCYHTLQPGNDPFAPPSIPALTPQGFVRWQTVQLLLEPEEHVPLLQAAVKRFDISNPIDGNPFPNWLPREALPSKPDPEMLQWHEKVADNLMIEVQKSQTHGMPGTHTRALSDVASDGTLEGSRDSHSRGSSTTDDQSLVNAANYFSETRRPFFRPPQPLHMPSSNRQPPQWRASREQLPWNPERRRSNSDPPRRSQSSGWSHRDGMDRRNTVTQNTPRPRPRPRSPSTVSTSSTSSITSSSSSNSDGSDDLNHHHHRTSSTATLQQPRRHSSHQLNNPQNTQPARQPATSNVSPFPHRPPPQQNSGSGLPHRHPSAPTRANTRRLNVRWGADSVHDIPPRRDRNREREGKSRAKSEERPRRSGGDRDGGDGVRGVGGRRYPTNGMAGWQ